MAGVSDMNDVAVTDLQVLFLNSMEQAAPPSWTDFCMLKNVDVETVSYPFMGAMPRMYELKDGDLEPHGLMSGDFDIRSKEYGLAIAIRKADLKFKNRDGLISERIGELADAVADHPVELLEALLNDTTTTCYDGATFFSSTHTAYQSGATQDNLLATSGATHAALQTDFWLAFTALRGFTDTNGNPIRRPNRDLRIVNSTSLEAVIMQLLKQTMIGTTAYTLEDMAKQLTLEGVTAADWMLFDLGRRIKPFVFQMLEEVQFGQITGEQVLNGEYTIIGPERSPQFLKGCNIYGARGWYGMGFGDWKNAVAIR